MKKLKLFAAAGLTLLLMSSCSSTSKSGIIAPMDARMVPSKEIKADLDLDGETQVTGNSTMWYFLGFRVTGGNKYFENLYEKRSLLGGRTSKAQSCAMYDALEKGDYDMIVNPQYINETHSFLFGLIKRYDVLVKGYGAKIKKVYQE